MKLVKNNKEDKTRHLRCTLLDIYREEEAKFFCKRIAIAILFSTHTEISKAFFFLSFFSLHPLFHPSIYSYIQVLCTLQFGTKATETRSINYIVLEKLVNGGVSFFSLARSLFSCPKRSGPLACSRPEWSLLGVIAFVKKLERG